jgi:hydroxyacylglutathione hydrolase
MRIHQIYVDNNLRNYNYLLACENTRQAIAIDPLDHKRINNLALEHNYTITKIVNTHDHHDHIEGNLPLLENWDAEVLAHHQASHIPGFTTGVFPGDNINFGDQNLVALDTPGHTLAHICLLFTDDQANPEQAPAFFSGDTLFNAGAGNCHNGGDVNLLYETFVNQIYNLDDGTRLYPGHDYLINNCQFTLDREPDNVAAKLLLEQLKPHDPNNPHITTLGEEKTINSFLRLNSKTIQQKLQQELALNPEIDNIEKAVFVALRRKRNQW